MYDQSFHAGVNIIRGENGSGKSTIADFIFYILGGEFDNWKTVAANCDEVQAEVATQGGVLTLRREIDRAQTPMHVFFGPMVDAEQHGLDGWETYPIRRSESRESFSQVLFRASGIPEAQSQGAANITMNQLMRLLYSDQRTPAAFLFRFEPFDTREIREAVGDLVCGLSVYELYEIELNLRKLDKQFDEKNRQYTALLSVLPPDEALSRVETIDSRVVNMIAEYDRLATEIDNVDELLDSGRAQEFIAGQKKAADELRNYRKQIALNEQNLHINELEVADLTNFLEYLEDLAEKLPRAQTSSDIVGNIDFTHCPACLAPLSDSLGPEHCVLCGTKTDPEHERSRYLQIKMDLDIQIRESRQLLEEKKRSSANMERELRRLRLNYQAELSEYTVRYEISISPRDSFVAERYQRLGQIDRELSELTRLRERALEIQSLSDEKAALQEQINSLKDRQKALEVASGQRRRQALTRVSETAKAILKQDLDRQDEFQNAQSVAVNFGDNSVLVDGELNFAESSNVIVKNAVILSLLLAATQDKKFYHPRFVLFDNIEDKGMEQNRSHNFQEIILRASEDAELDHQIIFTTSMFNPSLDEDKYAIGPHYTHENRTLSVG
ncbi:AAA family ATPase [Parvibaculum lavamentivorans]|uniref:AAA family ATPase n=1 Tax=Parvibaculum lavamentivorans TaxID=256618 RepID=UPI0000ED44B7|nr:AAA family ATPase [Parvibaculum lavamentivorans]